MTPENLKVNQVEKALIQEGVEQNIGLNDYLSMHGISKTSHYAKDPKSVLPVPNY
jgi:hypothetical protein